MVADAAAGRKRPRVSGFFLSLLSVVLVLLVAGIGGFWYLSASSPLNLLSGGDRPIAAATAFVPSTSPFTLSLLTKPDRLIALQQALADPQQRETALAETEQLKQSLFKYTGLSYDRDLQPWLGHEVTLAITEQDLDLEAANGQQAGYLLALEIAGDRTQIAREFLQTFWQRQALKGNRPNSELVSGVRVLYSPQNSSTSTTKLTAATALVGDQFILFANDVRVLKRSIRSAQTAENLAQNLRYRQSVSQLDDHRLGLAYVNTAAFNTTDLESKHSDAKAGTHFVAVSLGLAENGLIAQALLPEPMGEPRVSAGRDGVSRVGLVKNPSNSSDTLPEVLFPGSFLPGDSEIALIGSNLTQLAPTLSASGLSASDLPDFLKLQPVDTSKPSFFSRFNIGQSKSDTAADSEKTVLNPKLWGWADNSSYALSRTGSGANSNWILSVERQADGIAQLDQAATNQGYSLVPVAVGDTTENNATPAEAVTWARLTSQPGRRSGRQSASSSLEADVLALHLQLSEGQLNTGQLNTEQLGTEQSDTKQTNAEQLNTEQLSENTQNSSEDPLVRPAAGSSKNYEIFANSLAALDSALNSHAAYSLEPQQENRSLSNASRSGVSLLSSERFQQAIALLPVSKSGYFYASWPAVASEARTALPILKPVESALQPIFARLDTVAATQKDNIVYFALQLTKPVRAASGPSRR